MTINLVSISEPTSPTAEAYRRLRVNLMSAGHTAPLQTLLVAAAGPDQDKAATVANLAATFANVGKAVILVDCDLRHPAQHLLFGLNNYAGVTTVLRSPASFAGRSPAPSAGRSPASFAGRSPAPSAGRSPASVAGTDPGKAELPIQATELPGLRVLTSGPPVPVPSDLIASPTMAELIARLRQEADLVLFDAPPVVLATDAAEMATQVDGVLLTVSSGRTKRDDAQRAVDLLKKVGARLVGTVLINLPVDAKLRKYLSTP